MYIKVKIDPNLPNSAMSDLADVWLFTRERLRQAVDRLTDEQARWKPHPQGHSILEILYHLAGAEHYWWARLTGADPRATSRDESLDRAVTYGFLNDLPVPFAEEDMSVGNALGLLEETFQKLLPVFDEPTVEQLSMPLTSPIGDSVTGREGLIRLAQHAAYHTGQIWLIRIQAPSP